MFYPPYLFLVKISNSPQRLTGNSSKPNEDYFKAKTLEKTESSKESSAFLVQTVMTLSCTYTPKEILPFLPRNERIYKSHVANDLFDSRVTI